MDSASGVTGIAECLLKLLRKYFGGLDVSPLKSRPCQVSVANGGALKARYQTTNDLKVCIPLRRVPGLRSVLSCSVRRGYCTPNPQVTSASVAMAFHKGPGKGYHLLAVFFSHQRPVRVGAGADAEP